MFGKGLSVSERFENFRMDYLDMSHLAGDERYSYRLTYDGRWENNLYQFFRLVMPKLTFDLPRPFQMEGIQRVDDTLQHKAVREAFVNSIIHSDFFLNSGVLRIEKHDDKLCLRNPGTLLLPIEDIFEGGHSKSRNPRIQKMFRLIGFGENMGSGFPKILHAWKQVGWKKPVLENKLTSEEVELTLFTSDETTQETTQETTRKRTRLQNAIIDYLRNNPYATGKELADNIQGATIDGIKYNIAKLRKEGVIKHVGSTKSGYWQVINEKL